MAHDRLDVTPLVRQGSRTTYLISNRNSSMSPSTCVNKALCELGCTRGRRLLVRNTFCLHIFLRGKKIEEMLSFSQLMQFLSLKKFHSTKFVYSYVGLRSEWDMVFYLFNSYKEIYAFMFIKIYSALHPWNNKSIVFLFFLVLRPPTI